MCRCVNYKVLRKTFTFTMGFSSLVSKSSSGSLFLEVLAAVAGAGISDVLGLDLELSGK